MSARHGANIASKLSDNEATRSPAETPKASPVEPARIKSSVAEVITQAEDPLGPVNRASGQVLDALSVALKETSLALKTSLERESELKAQIKMLENQLQDKDMTIAGLRQENQNLKDAAPLMPAPKKYRLLRSSLAFLFTAFKWLVNAIFTDKGCDEKAVLVHKLYVKNL